MLFALVGYSPRSRVTYESARVHRDTWRRGRMAVRGACAAERCAGDRLSQRRDDSLDRQS